MSLTRKLEQLQLGLIKPGAFTESIRCERIDKLRASVYREVTTSCENDSGQGQARRNNNLSCGYRTIDIDKEESRYLLVGCDDGSVEIFDLDPISQSPKQRCQRIAAVKRRSHGCHQSHCNWVQWYAPDNGIFVTSGHDKTVKVWDTNQMIVVESFQFNMPVYMHNMAGDAAFGIPHNIIAVASDESNVRLADIRTGAQTQHLHGRHKAGVVCVQWSPYDSNILLSGGRDGCVFCWDVRSGKTFLKALSNGPDWNERSPAHNHPVVSLKFSSPSQANQLVSLDADGVLHVWDAFTLRLSTQKFAGTEMTARTLCAIGIDMACHTSALKRQHSVFVPAFSKLEVIPIFGGPTRKLAGHMSRIYSCVLRGRDYHEVYTASADKMILCFRPEFDDNPNYWKEVTADGRKELAELTQDDWDD